MNISGLNLAHMRDCGLATHVDGTCECLSQEEMSIYENIHDTITQAPKEKVFNMLFVHNGREDTNYACVTQSAFWGLGIEAPVIEMPKSNADFLQAWNKAHMLEEYRYVIISGLDMVPIGANLPSIVLLREIVFNRSFAGTVILSNGMLQNGPAAQGETPAQILWKSMYTCFTQNNRYISFDVRTEEEPGS